jgi:6,7-dimethyl-8-ribityllumazine synthase
MVEPRRGASVVETVDGDTRLLIVEARYYTDIADELLAGAKKAAAAAGAQADCITVPGSLEIPAAIAVAVAEAKRRGAAYHGAVALGCVIRGETFHFEIVSSESARALMTYSVDNEFPIGNGILTVETEAQAWVRAKIDEGDKGGDAVRAALAVLRIKRQMAKG